MKIIVIGAPGSGKSTQAELLARELFLPYVEGSDILAAVGRTKTEVGELIREAMQKGNLVEDSLNLMAIESHLQNPWFEKGFVLDGTPRTLWQAQNFKIMPDRVIYVRASDKVNTGRLLKRGRKDDQPAIIKKRLKDYHRQTEPVLDYYRKLGILEEVDGERPVEVILQDILRRLKS